jgi:hypothetical protein
MSTTETGERFSRGQSITMMFDATPENVAWLKAWSDAVPTLHFVDICVASLIKPGSTAAVRDPRKAALLARLRELDRPHNSFSYLLALAEKVTDTRHGLSDAELEAQILGDAAAMRAFFQHGRVIEDDAFLAGFARDLRGMPQELSRDACMRFLRSANDRFRLGDPVARADRLRTAELIVREADALPLPRQHPVVLVTLAALYRNPSAAKIMKFRPDPARFQPENALADIMVISRLLPRKLELEQMAREERAPFARCAFITDDTGLAGILGCFEGEATWSEDIGGDTHRTHTTMTVRFAELFTELPPAGDGGPGDEAARLREFLQN